MKTCDRGLGFQPYFQGSVCVVSWSEGDGVGGSAGMREGGGGDGLEKEQT